MTRGHYSVMLLTLGLVAGAASRAGLQAGQSTAQPASATYSLKAEMIDAENKAKQRSATVTVTAQGVQLVDPASVNETAKIGEGHLHYQVDDGPVIATPVAKLSFHQLAKGTHKISVLLAGNDHKPLTAPILFTVTIP